MEELRGKGKEKSHNECLKNNNKRKSNEEIEEFEFTILVRAHNNPIRVIILQQYHQND